MVKEDLSWTDYGKALGLYALALFLLFGAIYIAVPSQHNPLRPLKISEPIGFATYGKLTRAKRNPNACFAALESGDLDFSRIPNLETGRGCGFLNALTLPPETTPFGTELSMTCHQAAAVHIWKKQVVLPAAIEIMGSEITEIGTYGTYACRNVAGSRRRSEHAQANAIDVWGFRFEDGRTVTVKANWGKDTTAGEFLDEVFSGACRVFSVSLGPNFNAAHADHFHLDMGPGNMCR